MNSNGNSKIKFLSLLQVLEKYSDEEHPLPSGEICALMAKDGVSIERKSIYRDIGVLSELGIEILCTRTPRRGFFIAKRRFELPEVRLLMDAVLTAPFLTSKKTAELMGKLQSLLSVHQAESVACQTYVDQRVKFENEEIYYTIDAIHRAIAKKKRISFLYHHKTISGKKLRYDRGREFTISPYALLWSNDKYYLAGNYEKYDNVGNYRLDRIRRAAVTELDARPFSEVSPYRDFFDSADYLKKSFNMYNGVQELVELRCANEILEAVADKLGSGADFCCRDEKAFTVRARVYVSDGLIEWLLQYGNKIIVQSPKQLRMKIIGRIEEMSAAYQSVRPETEA